MAESHTCYIVDIFLCNRNVYPFEIWKQKRRSESLKQQRVHVKAYF